MSSVSQGSYHGLLNHIRVVMHLFIKGLCLNASLLDAHEDPHSGTQLPSLWQDFLPALASEGPHEDTHWGEALQLSHLPEELLRQI